MGSPTKLSGFSLNPSYLQITPLSLVILFFLLFPVITIIIVSFWDYNAYQLLPDFIFENYEFLLTSSVTLKAYLNTFYYAFMTWIIALVLGFTVAYYLAFYIKNPLLQSILFIVCTVPFLTSNIIRMISWIPLLGRNGLVNSGLQGAGITNEPLEWLLYSDFSVILAFVHLYTLFMVVPIFNAMMRIDRNLVEASIDAGASMMQTIFHVIIPLCKSGIAIGSIFIITLVMGDFITVRLMSGGLSASVGVLIYNEISLLQYPAAAAGAVILLITVLIMLSILFRFINIKQEL
ncbi:ABC transporter permease [Neptunomonas phycophila]|uniref:ABC transporter permease n=1 Tax=Neptunomonas phycophila TaxID=1572645 RepID=A0AAW7XLD1_9GAMM|nr:MULTISPECIES: ABC transporter permease [Neptunomonas]MDN2658877.1 ABC transporter permease [Neptunomonas sp. CHC150]MDO6455186.1 ABC transporter permease [Neptunomonas phycophila]MDO6468929.1 ABC transporter permease [Neptunomonas phycophila]MDP2522751.1 ABC transporter permease [Neptunomonas phycophila]QLE97191.1 ABC transporter permease [Neptunomonas phycophila]